MSRLPAVLLAFLIAALAAGCTGEPNSANTLAVLAGSELKDLEPLLPDLQRATGVKLVPTYVGTLEGAEKIASGDTSDVAWFSHGKYLSLLPQAGGHIKASDKIMLSPVVIGVKQSAARRFGWEGNPAVTWKDIQAKSADGSFRFAMTNPAASNSGLTALIGVAAALSGSSDAIDAGKIDKTALKGFFRGQALTAGSSGFLADTYVREQDNVDGIVNYESVLMGLNARGTLREPLDLIYPSEGIVTADYPFMLLNADKRGAYEKVVAFLRSPDVQKRIMSETLRRPAVPGVPLDTRFPTNTLIELPFPSKLDTIDALITVYLDEIRKPASAIFVLDVSGSMDGDRLNALKSALSALTGTDTTLTGKFTRFHAREEVTMVTFSTVVNPPQRFTIDDTNTSSPDMQAIRAAIGGLSAGGSTAIYAAMERAYEIVAQQQAIDPNRLYSIVLMTDGENNSGIDENAWSTGFRALPVEVRNVHTYPILFGESSRDMMQRLADLTGGQLFNAQSTSLETIFKQIRGYQ